MGLSLIVLNTARKGKEKKAILLKGLASRERLLEW